MDRVGLAVGAYDVDGDGYIGASDVQTWLELSAPKRVQTEVQTYSHFIINFRMKERLLIGI